MLQSGQDPTPASPWLQRPVMPLLALGRELGIPATVWAEREDAEQLSYSEAQIPREQVLDLTQTTIQLLAHAYGDALTCRFTIPGSTVLAIQPGIEQSALARFRDETRHLLSVGFELTLDKRRLVTRWLGDMGDCRVLLYLFPAALANLLATSPGRLEALLWGKNSARKVVVLVPDHDIWLEGPFLSVLGGSHLDRWRDSLPARGPAPGEHALVQQLGQGHLHWENLGIQHLSLYHLKLDGAVAPRDPIANALRVHQANLLVLFIADRASIDAAGQWSAVYEGSGQSIHVPLPRPSATLSLSTASGIGDLQTLVEWVYEPDWVADRLTLAQVSLAQLLSAEEPAQRFYRLVDDATNILASFRWRWKSVIGARLESYEKQVHALMGLEEEIVSGISDRISAMVRSLSETMLAGVVALLGSLIAAQLGGSFDGRILAIGLAAYGLYVLLFPFALNMAHQWGWYRSTADGFAARRSRPDALPLLDEVDQVIGYRLQAAERRFTRWFLLVAACYAVLGSLALALALLLPLLLRQ